MLAWLWLALIPGALWLALAHRTRSRTVSTFGLLMGFVLGALAVTPAGLLLLFSGVSYSLAGTPASQLQASFLVALCEESCKLLAVFALLRLEPTVRDRLDGTLGAISVGLGFASLESALYVSQLGEAVLLTRACTAVLAHSAFTGIAGYYLGLAREEGRFRAILVLKGLALAVLLHGAYDALLAWSGPSSIVAILLGVMVLITLAGALALLHGHLRMATEWSRIRRLLKL